MKIDTNITNISRIRKTITVDSHDLPTGEMESGFFSTGTYKFNKKEKGNLSFGLQTTAFFVGSLCMKGLAPVKTVDCM